MNENEPAVGRDAIADVARGLMTAFPDMIVTMDRLVPRADLLEHQWTFTGTNDGPGGTGRPVRISGYESWRFDAEGLIADSRGHFDAIGDQRQLEG